ncbi:hypothetical protein F4677DRAFT_406304 [Hypoxylon crocopeplum]|nr:hypothetical protein F4677DRAFT_406304 [Hypoxylon crocopeplum]
MKFPPISMHFITILSIATTSAAAVIPKDVLSSIPDDYIWQVTKWQAGMSHGNPASPVTSWYNFNVSGVGYGEGSTFIPPFAVHCEGFADGRPLNSNYASCSSEIAPSTTDASVSARVLPDAGTQAHIAISYLFNTEDELKTEQNFTVTIVEDWARERPPHNFTVKPTEVD